ncbi:MAG: arginine--tRNA ligase [Candidatus Cloacimonadota bacterium]|nr:MAG: arginine--tRNA ligase [Candidatus Cloacimonadota bacterium]PIE78107.1 MAG: arginine--tRNA ligase [Candidatus Delongbacteria bacterium]
MSLFEERIAEKLSQSFEQLNYEEILSFIENPKNPDFGDKSLPCFRFSKSMKKSPVQIGDLFIETFKDDNFFNEVTNVNGFLNFKFNREIFVKDIMVKLSNGEFYKELKDLGKGKVLAIDFSSPNIAKEFHIGHLRSTAIGNAISNAYELGGWSVKRINHLGDWGTQFGKLIYAYIEWGDEEEFKKQPIRYLQSIYVKFHKLAEEDPSLEDKGREWFKKLEEGDKKAKELWELFRFHALESLKKSYDRLNISFDHYWGEAFYEEDCKKVIEIVENSDAGSVSNGALIVNLEKYDMPPCLIRKSDGTSIYATRDLAAAIHRYESLKFDKFIYVTEMKQNLHFRQVIKSLELLGYEWANSMEHVFFGSIKGISTRKGNVKYLDDVFDEAKERALSVINEKNPNLEDKESIAESIGVGAVVFQDLSKSRVKDSEFNWERILAFDGETGPYIQYTFVRIHNILEKVGEFDYSNLDYSVLTDDSSFKILTEIGRFNKVLENCIRENEPSVIATYIISLSKAFNKFYLNNRVLGEEKKVVDARATLLLKLKEIMSSCMKIIGVPEVYKM